MTALLLAARAAQPLALDDLAGADVDAQQINPVPVPGAGLDITAIRHVQEHILISRVLDGVAEAAIGQDAEPREDEVVVLGVIVEAESETELGVRGCCRDEPCSEHNRYCKSPRCVSQ